MSAWANFIGYQIVWFALVVSAGRGRPALGIAFAALFIAWQLAASRRRALDAALMGAALALGVTVDGSLALLGWVRYAAPAPALPAGGAPVWILALWLCFALTLGHSLAWVMRRPWPAVAFGAIGAPLVYWGAARGWQAAQFAPPAARGLTALGLGWAAAMAVFCCIVRRAESVAAQPFADGSLAP